MNKIIPSLNILRVFAVAARHLSFKLAAQELFLSPPAVSHQIRVLEKHLGIKLFVRLNRSLELTAQGKDYALQVEKALLILEDATAKLVTQPTFNISCIPFITNALLIPHIQSFKDANPELPLQISSKVQKADVARGEVDVAIRHRKGDEPGLHYQRLTSIKITPICSQKYWGSIPQNQRHDMSCHKQINLSVDPLSWSHWLKDWHYAHGPKNALSLDSYQAVVESVKQDMGLAMGYMPSIFAQLNQQNILAPFPDQISEFGDLYLVYKHESAHKAEVVAFRSWLVTLLDSLNSDKIILPE